MLSIFATRADATKWSRAINAGRPKVKRIGIPQRPLKPKTQKRIAGGLDKWVLNALEPFLVNIENYGWDTSGNAPVSRPLSTITAGPKGGKHAAVDVELAACTSTLNHAGDEHRSADLRDPISTLTAARDARAVVAAACTAGVGGRAGQSPATSVASPLPTVTGKADRILVAADVSAYTVPRYGEREGQAPRSQPIDRPLPTVTGTDNGGQLIAVALNKHYTGVVGQAVDRPLGTITNIDHHSLLAVSLATFHSEKGDETRGQDAAEPLRTLDTQNRFAVVAAHLVKFRGESPGTSIDAPVDTITAGSNTGRPAGAGHAMGLACCYLSHMYTSNTCGGQGDPAKPLKTITSGGQHAKVCVVYVSPFYGAGSGLTGHTPAEPLPTVTSQDRFSLVSLETCVHWLFTPAALKRARQVAQWAIKQLGAKVDKHLVWVDDGEAGERFPLLSLSVGGALRIVNDILIRMLVPGELLLAQGFPPEYRIDVTADGTPVSKADQVKLVGNSVPPAWGHALARDNVVNQGVLGTPPRRREKGRVAHVA